MRKGFALIELLVVVVVLPVAMVAISAIFATFFRDVPRQTRLLQQNTSVLDMTRHLAKDMDRAKGLPDSFDTLHSDDRTLLVELSDRVVCYQLQDDGITRTVLGPKDSDDSDGVRTWRFRDAVITWRCRRQGERAYAVELQTRFRYRTEGRFIDKLAGSHIYFVNALGKALEVK